MIRTTLAAAALVLAAGPLAADGHKTPYPEGASVYFINVADGDTVASPLTIQFGLKGMGVAPAGAIDFDNVGHHHLLINRGPMGTGEMAETEWDETLPNNENHRHFGGGQTEVTLELPAGEHTLQMVFADYAHVPFGPDLVTEQITITVE